jgi:hypothetical protein
MFTASGPDAISISILQAERSLNRVKLFVWNGKGVLDNYGSGVVFVLAESVEEARRLATAKLKAEVFDWMHAVVAPDAADDDDREDLERSLSFLDREPEQPTGPIVYYLQGSN